MADLHATILARLAELRATAQAATEGPWAVHENGEVWQPAGTRTGRNSNGTTWTEHTFVTSDLGGGLSVGYEDAAHIAVWNPAAVLRWLDWADEVARDHHSDTDLESQRDFWECVACSHEVECNSDRCGTHYLTVAWPCPEIAGLARALDVTP